MGMSGGIEFITRLPQHPPRPEDAHKGTFGRVLIIAGSRGMSGASALAGLGALRGGAGLVSLAVPREIQPIVAAIEPSYLTIPLPEDRRGRISSTARQALVDELERSTVFAVGPGLGQSKGLSQLVEWLYNDADIPGVFDADALNGLAAEAFVFKSRGKRKSGSPARVVTPHPGEFARLLGATTEFVQSDREEQAANFARQSGAILVLKGKGTIITDGQRLAVNVTGNGGMATGGTGDVLTGLIASLLAQGMSAFDAAQLGAHLHGLAGDLAAAELSEPGLIASDLPRYVARAWRELPN